MQRKELKNLAQKIAKAEIARSQATDFETIRNIENEIIRLSGRISSVEEMLLLDDLVQDYIKEYSEK